MFKPFSLLCLALFLGSFSNTVMSQQTNELVHAEEKLLDLFKPITETQDFSEMEEINKKFLEEFKRVLLLDGAFSFPFNSLENIGKQTSPNSKIRLFTWNIPGPKRTQNYFGLVVLNQQDTVSIFELIDKRSEFAKPHAEQGTPQKWFGALYYEIVEQTTNNDTYYVLLGIDLNDVFSSKRIIEVLSIGQDGNIIFGRPIFRLNKNIMNRVVFEYSSRATMVLRWDKSYNSIVFSSLMPLQPSFAGNYQYYVPGAMFNGFTFDGAYWNFVEDMDVRNSVRERKPLPEQPEQENYDPGFLYRSGRKTGVQ